MVLNEAQISEILDIIQDHHNSFVFNNVTKELPDAIIEKLKNKGLIDPTANTEQYMKRAYELSRLNDVTEDVPNAITSFAKLKSHLRTNPVPMTDFEVAAIEHLTSTAKKYIEKHSELLGTAVDEVVRNQNMALRHEIISGEIKTTIARGVAERKSITQIVSDVRRLSDDTHRDFHRVVQTELQNAINVGRIDSIIARNDDKDADEILVYKRPNPDACKYCKSAYLMLDGVTPRVFKTSELLANGTNYGKKARDWLPVHEVHHPWCQCRIFQLQPGWGFKEGKLHFYGLDYDSDKLLENADENRYSLMQRTYDSQGNLKKACECCDSDALVKARSGERKTGAKYTRREGTPGHYKYFYDDKFKEKVSDKKKIMDKIKAAVKHHMAHHDSDSISHDELYDVVGQLLEQGHMESKTPISVLVATIKKQIEGAEKRGRGRPKKSDKPVDTKQVEGLRKDAEAETKEQLEDKEEYVFARESKIGNKGEDLLGSARHVRNRWSGIEDAEKDGTAEELVTRDKLLKNEPFSIIDKVDDNPMGAFYLFEAVKTFPPKPATKGIPDDRIFYKIEMTSKETGKVKINYSISDKTRQDSRFDYKEPKPIAGKELKKLIRKNYYESFKFFKGAIESTGPNSTDKTGDKDIGFITTLYKNRIDALQKQGDHQTANQMIDGYNKWIRARRRPSKTNALGKLAQLATSTKEDGKINLDKLREKIKLYMEGKSIANLTSDGSGGTKKFNSADLYVKHAKRKGPKTGLDTPEKQMKSIIDKNGIRGVQWGNSVTDDEREHHLKNIAESFKDLSDVLGIDESLISFNGQLGMAVGARGRAGASAHYESDRKVINLTRKNGVGSLAHEWGHMFDNLLHKAMPNPAYKDFLSEDFFRDRGAEGGSDVADAMQKVQEHMGALRDRINKMSREDLAYYSMGKGMKYWNSGRELFARCFEQYVQRKLEKNGRKNTYLCGKAGGHPFWPTTEETDAMMEAFDGFFEAAKKTGYVKKALSL